MQNLPEETITLRPRLNRAHVSSTGDILEEIEIRISFCYYRLCKNVHQSDRNQNSRFLNLRS